MAGTLMSDLVLLRHGQSLWNKEGRFTGWMDVDLSEDGIEEARAAGNLLKNNGYRFDAAYTSVLKRAIRTLWIVLDEMNLMWIPITASWRLNERFYGDLQGRSKKETEEKYGAWQVHRWRRGYLERPPALDSGCERFPSKDPKYRTLMESQIPRTESLKDTLDRLLPFWQEEIAADLRDGKSVFICAHGNTIRALVKHIHGISDRLIEEVEIPTGIPLVYQLDEHLRLKAHFYIYNEDGKIRRHSLLTTLNNLGDSGPYMGR
jgi:2,3-bisphosphoglycerate-dependent phosphoglycerate mutase